MSWVSMLFHVHTRASFDGILPVKWIINYCKRHKINFLIIADHDSMECVGQASRLGKKMGVSVIPAVEFTTDDGDIIGLFVKPHSISTDCKETLLSIREQGGLSVLPHPTRGHSLRNIPFEMIDLIESFNPRCSSEQNALAKSLCQKHEKPQLVGADAHFPWELGLALNYLWLPSDFDKEQWTDEDLKAILMRRPRRFVCKPSTAFSIQLSLLIKSIKLSDIGLMYQHVRKMAYGAVQKKPFC